MKRFLLITSLAVCLLQVHMSLADEKTKTDEDYLDAVRIKMEAETFKNLKVESPESSAFLAEVLRTKIFSPGTLPFDDSQRTDYELYDKLHMIYGDNTYEFMNVIKKNDSRGHVWTICHMNLIQYRCYWFTNKLLNDLPDSQEYFLILVDQLLSTYGPPEPYPDLADYKNIPDRICDGASSRLLELLRESW